MRSSGQHLLLTHPTGSQEELDADINRDTPSKKQEMESAGPEGTEPTAETAFQGGKHTGGMAPQGGEPTTVKTLQGPEPTAETAPQGGESTTVKTSQGLKPTTENAVAQDFKSTTENAVTQDPEPEGEKPVAQDPESEGGNAVAQDTKPKGAKTLAQYLADIAMEPSQSDWNINAKGHHSTTVSDSDDEATVKRSAKTSSRASSKAPSKASARKHTALDKGKHKAMDTGDADNADANVAGDIHPLLLKKPAPSSRDSSITKDSKGATQSDRKEGTSARLCQSDTHYRALGTALEAVPTLKRDKKGNVVFEQHGDKWVVCLSDKPSNLKKVRHALDPNGSRVPARSDGSADGQNAGHLSMRFQELNHRLQREVP